MIHNQAFDNRLLIFDGTSTEAKGQFSFAIYFQ